MNLASRLKTATASLHRTVERSDFMRVMLGGRLDGPSYCLFLRNLWPIYQALEAGMLRQAAHPALKPVCLSGLARTQALAADLELLHGPSWADDMEVLPASHAYATRLQSLGDVQPELLVAHAYVRYLGDLSGGQILRGIVSRSLNLAASNAEGAGTAFYHFGTSEEAASLAQALRAGLNDVTQDDACADRIAAEAVRAFGLHADLFQELAGACQLPQADVSLHP